MAALPYMQLYVADYLADTAHLTAAQHGGYLLLLFNYWQRGKPLNNSNERLANVARMSSDEWAENKLAIAEFFEIDGDEWRHCRVDCDLDAVSAKSTKATAAGKASASKRAASAKQDGIECSTFAEQTFNHTDTDTDKEVNPFVPSLPADDTATSKIDSIPDCPHQEIIDLYGTILPELPQPRIWEGANQTALRSRWRWAIDDMKRKGKEHDKAAGLAFFSRMFAYIKESDFLCGRGSTWAGADLGWIVKGANFNKILQGNYENKAAA